jgi:hypothetical protein
MAKYVGIAIRPYNDLELTADGNLRLVYDAEAVGQHARQRLSFYKGEWFLDRGVGVDWFNRVFGLNGRTVAPIAEAVAKAAILATPGVTAISEITSGFDRSTRGYIVSRCDVETEFDQIITV